MPSSNLSHDDNQKINILTLIILLIIILIFCLIIFYRYSMKYKSNILNNIIYGLTGLFMILIIITSILYIYYRYKNGDNIVDNIDIITKPIMSIIIGIIVAMIVLGFKNIVSSSKADIANSSIAMIIINSCKNRRSLPINLGDTPNEADIAKIIENTAGNTAGVHSVVEV